MPMTIFTGITDYKNWEKQCNCEKWAREIESIERYLEIGR